MEAQYELKNFQSQTVLYSPRVVRKEKKKKNLTKLEKERKRSFHIAYRPSNRTHVEGIPEKAEATMIVPSRLVVAAVVVVVLFNVTIL